MSHGLASRGGCGTLSGPINSNGDVGRGLKGYHAARECAIVSGSRLPLCITTARVGLVHQVTLNS